MSFTFREAKRQDVGLLIGLAGASGSGKSYSAMELATGLAGGKKFAVIDTEAGRALHYADRFKFDHGDLKPPFSPDAYLEAILAADKAGYPVIVVDSASHEHAGEGGLLDMQEAELTRMAGDDWKKRESCRMASWIKPKMAHKKFVARLLQLRAHLILCFRADEKVEMVKQDGKLIVRPKQTLTGLDGWVPICEKTLPYELTASFLLTSAAPGVPKPIKLQEQHKSFFPADRPITREAGRLLGEWARGGTSSGASAGADGGTNTIASVRAEEPSQAPDYIDADDVRDIETACSDAGIRMHLVVEKCMRDFGSFDKTPKEKKGRILEWIAAKRKSA